MDGWKILSCDGQRMLAQIRTVNESEAYEITVCNLTNFWREVLSHKDMKHRCKELNRRLEAPITSIIQHIQQTLCKHDPDMFSMEFNGTDLNTVNLKMRNFFQGGIPFQWEFSCKLLHQKESTEALLSPLIKVISSLQCVNEELIKIISKKDSEIRDYKDSGGKVSRPYLETSEFDKEEFDQDLRASAEYNAAINKDIFSIIGDDSVNAHLCKVESDLKNPRSVSSSSGLLAASQHKSPLVKIAGRPKNKRLHTKRKPPKGVEVSDSESGSNDEPQVPVKRTLEENRRKAPRKKKPVDRRKKLF